MGDKTFSVVSTPYNTTGFNAIYTKNIPLTSIPGYCNITVNQRICDYCNSGESGFIDNYRKNCTYPITIDNCSPDAPLVNSSLCLTGGSVGLATVHASGTMLLESLGIYEIDKYKCYKVLIEQGFVYLIIALVLR